MAELPASAGVPVELKAGECMFHHCLNFHATPQNITDRERRAFVMIFMAKGVCFNRAQSPNHILVSTIEVEDGQPLIGSGFPVA
jgi:ectoine hydroxylase-related dioxygenase (phytanoyl-CoA dioxygenase family)